jgi:hypothetical protein
VKFRAISKKIGLSVAEIIRRVVDGGWKNTKKR